MAGHPKYVLDTNCFIDASRSADVALAFEAFSARAAPRLYLSSVVASELRAGAVRGSAVLERRVLAPYVRRGRVLTPSAAAWDALGNTLAALAQRDGLVLGQVPRGFALDILLAYSCRESGAILVSANTRDLERVARVFAFDFVPPYPTHFD
ncbi:MAG: type II toxin-antitoxin system VapC family toxin [Gemmatimonadaceae bacterium]